jgi:rhodanese-related sulfurtransferase
VPLDRLDPQAVQAGRKGPASEPLYVICRSGSRASQACKQLEVAGLNVVNVEGGTSAWDAAGLPVVRGQKTISLERQVRIAAGFLVLVGAVLALTVHPYFVGLAAFVGAGLMFAGITDTCGMGMLLARMPWNQVRGSSGAACSAGLALLAVAVLAPATTSAVEHTRDSLDKVKMSLADDKAVLIDVREKEEWEEGRLKDARLLPLSVLDEGLPAEELQKLLPKGKVIYLHCAAGGRCLKAAEILQKQGFDARALKPGYSALRKAGFPEAKR